MSRWLAGTLAVGVLASLSLIFSGSVALADTPNPTPSGEINIPDPNGQPVKGSDLLHTEPGTWSGSGGWTGGNVAGVSTWIKGGPPEGSGIGIDPQVVVLGEPWYGAGGQFIVPYFVHGFYPQIKDVPSTVDPYGTGHEVANFATTVDCVAADGVTAHTIQAREGLDIGGRTGGDRQVSYGASNQEYNVSLQDVNSYPIGTTDWHAVQDCSGGIVAIHATVCVWRTAIAYDCHVMHWVAAQYRSGTNKYTGQSPDQALCAKDATRDYCTAVPGRLDGTDFQTVCGNPPALSGPFDIGGVFAGIGYYAYCLTVPINGWDADGSIPAAWNSGPVGQLTGAFSSSVPDGIACGQVAVIPVFGNNIVLNTCPVDFAPGFVKTVVGWVMVLGIAALIVRRILWVAGSKS